MSFTLSDVVPWGRSYDEYISMFALRPSDLKKQILGCCDGPAGFNSVLSKHKGSIVSVDPLYSFSAEQIKKRIDDTYEIVLEQTLRNKNEFIWKSISSIDELGRIRMEAMQEFLKDYDLGKKEQRYIDACLPMLPFADDFFDIALCSHFLFLYSEQLSEAFHYKSIKELCRVAGNVRIFPVLELGAIRSRYLDRTIQRLKDENYQVRLIKVAYEFQKGGNELLEVMNQSGCEGIVRRHRF
jgi:hypothetical protein